MSWPSEHQFWYGFCFLNLSFSIKADAAVVGLVVARSTKVEEIFEKDLANNNTLPQGNFLEDLWHKSDTQKLKQA
jgi:hypothetical protein